MERVNLLSLTKFVEAVFVKVGFTNEIAIKITNGLLAADKRGIQSHGVARLKSYLRLIQEGRINTNPNFNLLRENATCGTLDADGAIGIQSASYAMELALEKCKKYGSGWIAVQNSNHFGIAAHHAMQALPNGFIGFAVTNASPLVNITRGTDRIFGTNPICVAVPTNQQVPFVLDMATSAVSNGKIEIAQLNETPLLGNWVQTATGVQSIENTTLTKGGSLLPLGGTEVNSSYKGYGLAAWVDIFSGVLSGANYGKFVPPFVSYLQPLLNLPGKGIGHFVGAWDVSGFRDLEEFKAEMDEWILHIKKSKKASEDPILIPGEKEHYNEIESSTLGVLIDSKVLNELKTLGQTLKIEIEIKNAV